MTWGDIAIIASIFWCNYWNTYWNTQATLKTGDSLLTRLKGR